MKLSRIAIALALAGLSAGANATNGYFSHGYGMKSKGMAGASTTSTDDAFFGANNPAAAAFVGDRMDLGADLFSPIRDAKTTATGQDVKSDSNLFLVPEFGYNHMMSSDLALGISVYGNGGMNTDYKATLPGNTNILGGGGALGVDLSQLIIAPTAAYKVSSQHSLGISPLLGYQRFKAYGLSGFDNPFVSTSAGNVTNKNYDDAFGFGVRVGYLGKVSPDVTVGAAYASKMNFKKLGSYAGLFANAGEFDIPENYNLGVAWQATPVAKLSLDYQRINYSKIDSVGNPVANIFNCPAFGGTNPNACLGGSAGPGFGWDDVKVWKLGAEYKYSSALTLRAGYSHANNPIKGTDPGEVSLNILAPAVIENHATLGFTYTRANGDEITMAYMHGFENSVTGADVFAPPGNTVTIKMHQDSLGVQYSWK